MHNTQKLPNILETEDSINNFVSKISSTNTIGLDTEFVRIRTYYPKLCLVQISSNSGTGCIDCLQRNNLNKVWQLIFNPNKLKIFHSARQDLEILFLIKGQIPENIFDTQIAAALLGYPPQVGIKQLLKDELNIEISKTETRSDWSKRPLDLKQIEYALEDVNHLLNLHNALKNKSCDARSITTKEYNIILVKPERGELGFVGIPTEININVLDEIIKANEIPVIAPMGLKDNKPFNINADTAAGTIAKELKSRRLLLMTDIEGVIDRNNKLVSEITPDVAKKMINEEVIKGGMIPKINTCIDAVNNGVRGVVIIDGRKPHSILFELFSDKGSGTLIRK